MSKAVTYLFVLAIILMLGAWYIGLTTEASTLGKALVNVLRTVTGQNATGTGFNSYPANGGVLPAA